MARLNHAFIPCLTIFGSAVYGVPTANARKQTGTPPFSTVDGGPVDKTLKTLLSTLLLLCGLSSAQNPVPTTSIYEDHGPYFINLQDLSIGFNISARRKSGLIPLDASGIAVANKWSPAQNWEGSYTYLRAGTTGVTIHALPVSGAGSTGSTVACSGPINTTVYDSWTIATSDGNQHSAYAISSSNPYVDKMTGGTSCFYSTMTAATNDGSNLTVVVTVNPDTAVVYGPSG
jgi:hypothetical protein